jgi:DNA-binding NarL/FixJ family response regulator
MSEYNKSVVIDGERVTVPMTDDEVKEWQESSAAMTAQRDAQIAARKSALAKLAALGLTETEIAAL